MKVGLSLLAVLATCFGASDVGATAPSGLFGVAKRGPIQPVCSTEQPCSAPAKGVTIAFERRGRIVARAKTDARGRYRVPLAPGVYDIRLAVRPPVGRGVDPSRARVPTGRFARIDLSLDTGIR